MSDALTPVLEALDELPAPLAFFVRDDDAGWNDARLLALLDVTGNAGVPIDLAAIPQAVSDSLASELNARIDAEPALLGVHQHGYAHLNHETEGRSCEFGLARDRQAQRTDLLRGRSQLAHRMGSRVQPIFTPPWNRCAAYTAELLAELGFLALSRSRGATSGSGLRELPVDVDWTRHVRAGAATALADALATAVRARGADGEPLGLMLHHAVMEPGELELLHRWLRRLVAHPLAEARSMRALISRPAQAPSAIPSR